MIRPIPGAIIIDAVISGLMWAGIGAVLLFFLTACASGPRPDPKVVTQKVEVAVSKPCVPADVGPAPAHYPDDTLTADSSPSDRYRLKSAANEARKARLAQVEPVLAGCRK